MSWLNTAFPWVGLAGAIVLLALLFATNLLRSDPGGSRWRDLTWLSWAGAVAYLLHNVEEYGIDLLGQTYAFPKVFCGVFGFQAIYPTCPVPPQVFTAVNVPMFWLAAPVAALMSKRHPVVGLTIYSVISVNMLTHIVQGVASGTFYNPGFLTAVVLFLPLTAWMIYALFVTGPLSYRTLAYLIGWGIALHLILMAAMLPLLKGLLHNATPSTIVQIINAALLIVAPLCAERWLGKDVYHSPVKART
jgi:hypothetical protein